MALPEDTDADAVVSLPTLTQIRARYYKLIQMVQAHEGRFGEHAQELRTHTRQLDSLTQTTVTKEQLNHAVETLTLKLGHEAKSLHEAIDPVRHGIYWVVALVLGAMLLALVGLVLQPHP